jgi:hypothetical protein
MLYCQYYVNFIHYTPAWYQESILKSSAVSRPFCAKHRLAEAHNFSSDQISHFFSARNNTLIWLEYRLLKILFWKLNAHKKANILKNYLERWHVQSASKVKGNEGTHLI